MRHSPNYARHGILTMMIAGLVLTGCGDPDTSADQISEDDPHPVGEFSAEQQQSGWQFFRSGTEDIYPTEIRAVTMDGFERIIIEHAGRGLPTYEAHYTDEPRDPNLELPVVTGDAAHLEILVSDTALPDEPDRSDMIEHNTHFTDLQTITTRTVVSFAPWQDTSHYVLGLDEQRPYAVAILEDPVRVVIDIQCHKEHESDRTCKQGG